MSFLDTTDTGSGFVNGSDVTVNISPNDLGKVQADQLYNAVQANPTLYNKTFLTVAKDYKTGQISPTEFLNAYEYDLGIGAFHGSQSTIKTTVENTQVGNSPQGANYVPPKTTAQLESSATRLLIMDRETTHGGSPVTKTIDLSLYSSFKWAELRVNLLANDPNALGSILPVDWRLTKFTINDSTFYPSEPQNSSNIILNNQDNGGLQNVLVSGTNTVSVYFSAPIGAGVISPDAEITAELYLIGDSLLPIPSNIAGLLSTLNLTNFENWINTFLKNATLPTFAILIIIAIIIIGGAYIMFEAKPLTHTVARVV